MSDLDLLYDYIMESYVEACEKEDIEEEEKNKKEEKRKEEEILKIKKRKRNLKLMNGEMISMKINNDIYETCYNYEGFKLEEYGRAFNYNDSVKINKDRFNNYDIKELAINIIGYEPFEDKHVVILSSDEFKEEIKSDKLRVDLVRSIYHKINEKYLSAKNNCISNHIMSLKEFIKELYEEFVSIDKAEMENNEKMFKEECEFICRNKNIIEKMNINSFLAYCRKNYNMNDNEFLEFYKKKTQELYPEQQLWIKILKYLHPNARIKI